MRRWAANDLQSPPSGVVMCGRGFSFTGSALPLHALRSNSICGSVLNVTFAGRASTTTWFAGGDCRCLPDGTDMSAHPASRMQRADEERKSVNAVQRTQHRETMAGKAQKDLQCNESEDYRRPGQAAAD